ncbi:hypothetical protein MNV49_004054 [Pseudohyphozyma bogoriensis]|nr:hypothetical protein MNV49_004054 [Pseudohyphozyma bogoriensis]
MAATATLSSSAGTSPNYLHSPPPPSHSTVVPAYPYNVSIVPNRNITPDDSGINTRLPSVCVDYLSHDWAEDDVWASWKQMTRHKSEIANGVRLENASWRTWAKQRGNLKTISPETLNWLKDSDVTWLYGPLHTAVDAVPPPKVATANERLGLEPLRTLSDTKAEKKKAETVASVAPQSTAHARKSKKVAVVTKPILKYRSLSDILLPAGTPSSPILEFPPSIDEDGADDDQPGATPVTHAKSDSNLVRMGSATRRSRFSPASTPRASSPEGNSDSSTTLTRSGSEKRHISFNHRVEQCIAVDSTEDARRYPSYRSNSDSDEDGDDEDDVLTFRSSSSPRVANFGPSGMTQPATSSKEREPHTIARLGPTTLKSTEVWPAPSPAVVYHQMPMQEQSQPGRNPYPNPVATYSARPPGGRRAMYDYSNSASTSTTGAMPSGWDPDDDEDYAMGFDYFNGPDVGVGDEYDMAQYGSQHLVGTSHNHYQGGTTGNAGPPYLGTGAYAPPYGASPTSSTSNSASSSNESSPNHSRRSSNNPSTSTSPTSPPAPVRGPHSPSNTRDALPPKRSILKGVPGGGGRSRENSAEDGSTGSPTFASPPHSGRASPIPSSPSSLGASRPGYNRRTSSEEVFGERESRGRSASRGSSSSLERSASSDARRSSISPTASYASIVASGSSWGPGAPGPRKGSSESLSNLANQLNAARVMPDLPEASSESETETLKAVVDDETEDDDDDDEIKESSNSPVTSVIITPSSPNEGPDIETVEDVEIPGETSKTKKAAPAPVTTQRNVAPGPKSPPLVPAPAVTSPGIATSSTSTAASTSNNSTANHPSTSSGGPRYRQPSPSAPTTSTTTERDPISSATEAVPSLSNSPSLDPAEFASPAWADEKDATPSYARRSLLRAARGGSSEGRDESSGRGSVDSGRSGHQDDYGFGLYDEDGESGLVGRTLDVVGSARDLLGAITKGVWNIAGGRSAPAPANR